MGIIAVENGRFKNRKFNLKDKTSKNIFFQRAYEDINKSCYKVSGIF